MEQKLAEDGMKHDGKSPVREQHAENHQVSWPGLSPGYFLARFHAI